MGTLFLFRLDFFPGGGYDVRMAIYTTELLTDRDYNIPEGRLPLEYAVDTANKAKTHSEDAEVHVTAEEKAAWNAVGGGGGIKAINMAMYAGEETYTNEDGYPVVKYGEVYIPESAPTGWYCVGTKFKDVDFGWVEHTQGERTLVWRPLMEQLTAWQYAPHEYVMAVPGWYTAEAPMTFV